MHESSRRNLDNAVLHFGHVAKAIFPNISTIFLFGRPALDDQVFAPEIHIAVVLKGKRQSHVSTRIKLLRASFEQTLCFKVVIRPYPIWADDFEENRRNEGPFMVDNILAAAQAHDKSAANNGQSNLLYLEGPVRGGNGLRKVIDDRITPDALVKRALISARSSKVLQLCGDARGALLMAFDSAQQMARAALRTLEDGAEQVANSKTPLSLFIAFTKSCVNDKRLSVDEGLIFATLYEVSQLEPYTAEQPSQQEIAILLLQLEQFLSRTMEVFELPQPPMDKLHGPMADIEDWLLRPFKSA